jgi:hypothetical protein
MVFPFVLGTGHRLFGDTSGNKSLRLVGARPVGESLAHLRYEVVREAQRARRDVVVDVEHGGQWPLPGAAHRVARDAVAARY